MSGSFVLDPRIGVECVKARFEPHAHLLHHFRLERGKQPEIARAREPDARWAQAPAISGVEQCPWRRTLNSATGFRRVPPVCSAHLFRWIGHGRSPDARVQLRRSVELLGSTREVKQLSVMPQCPLVAYNR